MMLNNNGMLRRMKGTQPALYYYPYSFLERLGETTNYKPIQTGLPVSLPILKPRAFQIRIEAGPLGVFYTLGFIF